MGYHKNQIKKGELGEISKIQEELDELKDADDQGCQILKLCELADLYGAMEAYLEKYFGDIHMMDLHKMSRLTKKAFQDGSRK